jgi:hypothetical protein
MQPRRIFICYPRVHDDLVTPFHKRMEAAGNRVFRDINLPPGSDWQPLIAAELKVADEIILLWCCHAANSKWIADEVDQLTQQKKMIHALLACDCPLPPYVDKFQAIDCRANFVHDCRNGFSRPAVRDEPSRRRPHYQPRTDTPLWSKVGRASCVKSVQNAILRLIR